MADGSSLEADVVIGADGLRSTVREYVAPGSIPEYSGHISWRALIPAERVRDLDLKSGTYDWIGPNRVLAVYWCSAGRQLNFLANVPADDPRQESWSTTDGTEELRRSFADAVDIVKRIIDRVENPFVTGMFDRQIPDTFYRGSVVLLGDAAHPVVPYLANGAVQAMEDAHVLARMLARASSGELALATAMAEYETRRRKRVERVQQISREMLKLSHVTDESELQQRNDRLKALQANDPDGVQLRGWTWEYDVISDTERDIQSALSGQDLKN
jgi:salicylate hydroxylase